MLRKSAMVALALLCASPVSAWWGAGHEIITRGAIQALPKDFPEFFRTGAGMVAHMTQDPDLGRNRATPLCSAAEHGEHYLDLELLDGADLPLQRYEFIALCDSLGQKPEAVGLVPYAVAEWTERLAIALAEHRKWPDNYYIQNKCLVYAGYLAHYAQDMSQPLHTTIHFDGRRAADGTRSQRGIHEKVDALPEFFKMTPKELSDVSPAPLTDLMPQVIERLMATFALVDRVYELGPQIPKFGQEDWVPNETVKAFAYERVKASAEFTASLFLTAWERSKEIRLPGWVDRGRDTMLPSRMH